MDERDQGVKRSASMRREAHLGCFLADPEPEV